jgi:signal transduction histidine kinase
LTTDQGSASAIGDADGARPDAPVRLWTSFRSRIQQAACSPGDDEEAMARKVLFVVAATLVVPAGLIWGVLYFAYGERTAALIPLAYCVLSPVDLAILLRTRRYEFYRLTQMAMILVLPFALQLALGGWVDGSAVIFWSFIAVTMALLFGGPREALLWFGAYVALIVVASVAQPGLAIDNVLPRWLVSAFFALNVGTVSAIVFVVLYSFMADRRRLRELEVAYLNQEVMLRQSEKLATLGTLAAGIAHELNNPAAAAARGVAQLRPLVEEMRSAYPESGPRHAPDEAEVIRRAAEVVRSRDGRAPSLTPLQRSDREEDIAKWLRDVGLHEASAVAGALADLGYTRAELEELTSGISRSGISEFLTWAARSGAAERLLAEIGEGAKRISQIVHAMRSYTYLDQAPVQNVDVTEGLEDTLVLLASKLRSGIAVRREYQEGLPTIEAYGSELNQVWTNIIENAAAALNGEGTITLRTRSRDGYVVVEIEDDGPGMPPEVAARVFDPFFTTKSPGQGTGLGLNISHSIVVNKHGGRIEVDSRPGQTTFRVSLPITHEARLSA